MAAEQGHNAAVRLHAAMSKGLPAGNDDQGEEVDHSRQRDAVQADRGQ